MILTAMKNAKDDDRVPLQEIEYLVGKAAQEQPTKPSIVFGATLRSDCQLGHCFSRGVNELLA